MASYINTNIASLNAQRNLTTSQSGLTTALQRLSSGMRINSAKDDAAGLAISERMTSQINGSNQAARNANDGISLAQTAEGDLSQISNNLQRMRDLSVQSANATNSSSDRAAIQNEITQLGSEIDRVAQGSSFNGVHLLDGTFNSQTFQVGANNVAAQDQITISSISSARTSTLGQFQGFTLTNQSIGTASNTAAAQTVTVGGSTVSLGTIANDAKALASAINNSGVSGLGATANATSVAAGTSAVTGIAGASTLTLNGLAISITNSTNAATNRTNSVTAINAQSSVTGVVATDTGSGVSLAAADGRNIVTTFAAGTSTGATEADYGLAAAGTTGATLNVTYKAPAGTTGNVVFAGAFSNTTAIASTGTAISAINVSTAAGAQTALTAIDAALSSVNTSRASLGAYQNRFASVVSSLQTTSENLTASRSRIQDTDFAAETAALTRGQILQQAGTAMLAQANALPNGVLALLR